MKKGVLIMETSLISAFASLSIILGLLVGFGTRSVIRGIFTFLIFIGLILSQLLGAIGVNEYLAYFLGQIIIMLPVYLTLRGAYSDTLVKVKQKFQMGSGRCH
jgi:hypothetical protein